MKTWCRLGLVCFFCMSGVLMADVSGVLLIKTKDNISFGIVSHDKLYKTLSDAGVPTLQQINYPRSTKRASAKPEIENILIVKAPSANQQQLLRSLQQLPDVDWIEPLQPVTLFSELMKGIPNDPRYAQQKILSDTMLTLLLHMPIRRSVRVAVIDSGIDYTHEDLFGNIWKNLLETPNGKDDDGNGFVDDIWGYDFYNTYLGKGSPNPKDGVGHGTHLAGIIGAGVNNQTGVTGLHPSVQLLNIRFTSDTGEGNQLDAAMAIRYAMLLQADIVVCGWGSPIPNRVLRDAIDDAVARGIVVVAAMGNAGVDQAMYPAAFPGVIAVGAVTVSGERAAFSNYGEHTQFVAFGDNILSTLPNNHYGRLSGTSQSAAMMAGTIARMLSAQPRLTREELNTHLLLAADPIVYPQKNPYTGYGILNPETLFKTLNLSPEPDILTSGWKSDHVAPTPAESEDFWGGLFLAPWRFLTGVWSWLI